LCLTGQASQRVGERGLPLKAAGSRPFPGQCHTQESLPGKLLSPSRKRKIIIQVQDRFGVSQRRACTVLSQARKTQQRVPHITDEEERLVGRIIELATQYGRYGYRRITALLNNKMGWRVNHKRVERIWRREGLKIPQKQPKRGRLWLNDGSCIRLRPEHKDMSEAMTS